MPTADRRPSGTPRALRSYSRFRSCGRRAPGGAPRRPGRSTADPAAVLNSSLGKPRMPPPPGRGARRLRTPSGANGPVLNSSLGKPRSGDGTQRPEVRRQVALGQVRVGHGEVAAVAPLGSPGVADQESLVRVVVLVGNDAATT